MTHIAGQIVVTDEDGILEIVGQQAGAGGALTAEIRPESQLILMRQI